VLQLCFFIRVCLPISHDVNHGVLACGVDERHPFEAIGMAIDRLIIDDPLGVVSNH